MLTSVQPRCLLPVVGLAMAAVLAWPAPAQAGHPGGGGATGRFTCRGSAIRAYQLLGSVLEPTVANGPEDPCATDNRVLLPVGPLGGLDLSAQVLVADTEDSGAPVTSEALATNVNVLGLVSVQVLEARAKARSINGQCVLSGESTATSAVVNGIPINLINGHTEIPIVGVGKVHFNETLRPSSSKLIQRALWVEITNTLVRSLTGVKEVVVGEAIVDFEGGNPCGGTQTNTDKRRMTGGGSFNSVYGNAHHGFVLHCNIARQPNNLEVNWGGNKFKLDTLTWAACTDKPELNPGQPAANFDTYYGEGTGKYNGVAGAKAVWRFTDAGEPGVNDTVRLEIRNAGGQIVFQTGDTQINQGNHQAHSD